MIYNDPDESLSIDSDPCPGLEALTGADLVVSSLPIPPTSDIQWHIQNNSIFVQLKRSSDALTNFEQRHKFAARVQKLGVKIGRAYALGIGVYSERGGMLVINGRKTDIPYKTYLSMQLNEAKRGIIWQTIDNETLLQSWCDSALQMATSPNSLSVYTKASYNWQDSSDFWQEVEEVQRDSVAHILACGLPGFGPKTVKSTIEYMTSNCIPVYLHNALRVLTDIDNNGKRLHKIPGIGQKTFEELRRLMFHWESGFDGKVHESEYTDTGYTMTVYRPQDEDTIPEFRKGGIAAINQFHVTFQELIKNKMPAARAYEIAINSVRKALEQMGNITEDNQIGF